MLHLGKGLENLHSNDRQMPQSTSSWNSVLLGEGFWKPNGGSSGARTRPGSWPLRRSEPRALRLSSLALASVLPHTGCSPVSWNKDSLDKPAGGWTCSWFSGVSPASLTLSPHGEQTLEAAHSAPPSSGQWETPVSEPADLALGLGSCACTPLPLSFYICEMG